MYPESSVRKILSDQRLKHLKAIFDQSVVNNQINTLKYFGASSFYVKTGKPPPKLPITCNFAPSHRRSRLGIPNPHHIHKDTTDAKRVAER